MQPTELPPRSARPSASDNGQQLHDEVVELARALPGTLRRLTVRDGDRAVEVEWAPGTDTGVPSTVGPAPVPTASAAEGREDTTAVRAPLVGTFYSAASPGADPFVSPGTDVEAGQPLGIVEAMKLLNPIVADTAGTVVEVLVENGESVEYDQVLMLLRPREMTP